MKRIGLMAACVLILAATLPAAGAEQSGIDLSKAILLPAPEGKLWLVAVIDGKPVAFAVSPAGPFQPGPQPGPGPTVKTIDVITQEEAARVPADARKDAATLAEIYRATARQFKPGGPIGTFNAAIAVQRESREKILAARAAAWNPVAEALGKWLNAEMAAGRLKKDDMPALAAIMGKIADGLERVK